MTRRETSRPNFKKRYGLVLGALSIVSASPLSANAANRATAEDRPALSAATDDSNESTGFSLIASDRGRSSREAIETREPTADRGVSLILMEIRTQRGSATSTRTAIPALDPRTKPLGW
jgi:hypothetical protein